MQSRIIIKATETELDAAFYDTTLFEIKSYEEVSKDEFSVLLVHKDTLYPLKGKYTLDYLKETLRKR